MNQAGNGDCILIESESSSILIDGGTAASFEEWKSIITNTPALDCLFVTHIDDDHVNGIIKLISSDNCVEIKNIIFNGAKQVLELDVGNFCEDDCYYEAIAIDFTSIPDTGVDIGYSEGTSLSYILEEKNYSVNEVNFGKAIHVDSFEDPITIGCFEIDFIGPSRDALKRLKDKWFTVLNERGLKRKIISKQHAKAFESYVNDLGDDCESEFNISYDISDSIVDLSESKYLPDKSLANETSLAFIVRANGKSVLMLGDSHVETIIEWMDCNGIEMLDVDAVKVSHHGSKGNINKEFMSRLNCNKYFISTNGKIFSHPDVEAISKIARYSKKRDVKIYMNNQLPHISGEFSEKMAEQFKDVEMIFDVREMAL
jgi:beta-lactamase superfamily II metal-dependent hydrolase